MDELNQTIKQGRLSFYGYSYSELPKEIENSFDERVEIFFKRNRQKIRLDDSIRWGYYSGYQDIFQDSKDIVFFDQDATKSLCLGFPKKTKLIMISLRYPKYYFFIILGLVGRLFMKTVSIKGVVRLSNGSKYSPWLLLKCKELQTNSLSINKEIGIKGLLEYLKVNNIDYVVPRHYEALPNLHREGGDLDLIVSDKDEKLLKQFLLKNEGEIPVDVWSVSNPDNHGIPYMPSNIAQDVIDNSIEGKASAKIPNPMHAFNCIVFHALYQVGFRSGVPSEYHSPNVNLAKNNYLGSIKEQSSHLGLTIDNNMESLDRYMLKIKWRPPIRSLAKIAQWNEWVRIHHFKQNSLHYKNQSIYYKYLNIKTKVKSVVVKLLTH